MTDAATLDDLQDAVNRAVHSGQIGTPVSLRLNLQDAPPTPLNALLARGFSLISTALGDRLVRLHARRHATAEQMDVLLNFESGASSLITVGAGAAAATNVRLLLIGNHGAARLEGDVSALAGADAANDHPWLPLVERSLAQGGAVSVA